MIVARMSQRMANWASEAGSRGRKIGRKLPPTHSNSRLKTSQVTASGASSRSPERNALRTWVKEALFMETTQPAYYAAGGRETHVKSRDCTPRSFRTDRPGMDRVLYVLTGPTAVGKTEWALRWAETFGAEIVSCDSLLFYRGMDVGTAKPTAAERRRVVRALERCLASRRTLADLAEAFARQPSPFADWQPRVVQLDRPRAELEARVDARVRSMLAAGLVEEVRRLVAAGLRTNPSAAKAIGYRETIACLEGRMREDDLAAAIGNNTRALVKKQLTWFRTQLPPHPVWPAGELDLPALFQGAPVARPTRAA